MVSKDIIASWCSVVVFLIGVGLIITSFFLPPMGVVDNSVITASGLILTAGVLLEFAHSDREFNISVGNFNIHVARKKNNDNT